MKDFFAPLATLLVAASFNGATAAASLSEQESRKLGMAVLGVDVWTPSMGCTADPSSMGLMHDEATCKTTKDSSGTDCLWCHAHMDGKGLCVSLDIKTVMDEDIWDRHCTAPDDGGAPVDPPAVTPAVTSSLRPKSEQDIKKLAATARDSLAELLSASPKNPKANAVLGVGSWTDSLACTADLSSMGLIGDEATCKTTMDSAGAGCLWCDASAIAGFSLCVGPDIKNIVGEFWDQLCPASDDGAAPVDPPAVTPAVTSSPRPKSEQDIKKLAATARDSLAELLSASPKNPKANAILGVGGWTDSLACTADLSSMALIGDEATCKTTMDSAGAGCLWCDASAIVGFGVCVGPDIKNIVGDYWDQLCPASDDASDDGAAPVDPVDPPPVTPAVTPSPTAAPDNDNIPDALKCSVDGSMSLITDKEACVARTDSSSTSGDNCAWCKVPLLGGKCITNGEKSTIKFLCKDEDEEGTAKKEGKYLRGDHSAWKKLDPSCLGEDGLAHGDEDGCGAKNDSNGKQCIWCAGGEQGICATPSQMDFLSTFMTCVDPNSPLVGSILQTA